MNNTDKVVEREEGYIMPNENGQGYKMKAILWSDKNRWFFGKKKFSFTEYSLTDEKIYISSGMIFKRQDEIRLYRVLDVSVYQGFINRLFKLGNVVIMSSDSSCPKLRMEKITNAYEVAEMISDLVEKERANKNIRSTEFIGD